MTQLQAIASQYNVPAQVIGSVGGSRLVIQPLLQLPVDELRALWSTGLTARLK